jgi:hypothetical protein
MPRGAALSMMAGRFSASTLRPARVQRAVMRSNNNTRSQCGFHSKTGAGIFDLAF